MIYFSKLEFITGGRCVTYHKDQPISVLLTDSRKAFSNEGAIFFAIKGERHDGHHYLNQVYSQGIRQFVVETVPSGFYFPDCNVLQVQSSVVALQKIATFYRRQFTIPIIGITGSNGKTIIKEWLYQMLSIDTIVVKNPGSYNSQIGVPLSVWQLQKHHQIGIFEAGVSRKGEMQMLEEIIQPTVGIFTNIGSAHDEGFTNLKEKISEKLLLFSNVEVLIYCTDHIEIDNQVKARNINTFTWGISIYADVQIHKQQKGYLLYFKGDEFLLQLPFSDEASAQNCFHCVTLLLYLGIEIEKIQARINNIRSIPMRLELKEGMNHCFIIDDTYNNDLGGLEISLQFLSHQHQKKTKRLILSDILESGLEPEQLSKRISYLLDKSNVHHFIGIGPILCAHQNLFPSHAKFYRNTQEFLEAFDTEQLHDEMILIKGARPFRFEIIVNKLQRSVHGTVMEIDLGALVHNLNYFKSLLKPSTKLMVMVKALAYGNGSNEIANLLQYHKIDYLGVAYTDEGIELRKNNITLPIMVMNPTGDNFDQIINYNLEPEIYNFKILHSLINFLQGKSCTIHIKIDTGMHRLGFEEKDITTVVHLLQSNPQLRVASIFSHLVGADESGHDDFSRFQISNFLKVADQITKVLGYKALYHILNSSGILRLPNHQLDMVRLGIGLYGVDPTTEHVDQLKPVATLKTIVSQIKRIQQGSTIGYGRKGIAERDMVTGTLAIGYADGFSRAFSQGVGEVIIRGKRAKVIGNVCMDMTMVDLTDIENAEEGDVAYIYGKELPIQEVAAKINTITYEILTSTSERVKRVFIAESI